MAVDDLNAATTPLMCLISSYRAFCEWSQEVKNKVPYYKSDYGAVQVFAGRVGFPKGGSLDFCGEKVCIKRKK